MPRASSTTSADRESIGRSYESNSDRSGRDDRESRSSRRGGAINDDFGDRLEKAGYARANDPGGWREEESSDSYTSTSDRMNRHLERYGSNAAYTSDYIRAFRNGGFGRNGKVGSGASAISRGINSFYQGRALSQSSPANISVDDQRNLTGGLFGKKTQSLDYSPALDTETIGVFTPNERLRDMAHYNTISRLESENNGNIVGDSVASAIGAVAEPGSIAAAGVLGTGQILSGKAGTISEKIRNRDAQVLDKLTPGQRAYYSAEKQRVEDAYREDLDSFKSRARDYGAKILGVGATFFEPVGGGIFGSGINNLAKSINHSSAMKHAAEKLNSPAIKSELAAMGDRYDRAAKARAEMKEMAGSNDPSMRDGILGAMRQRLNNNAQTTEEEVYGIPQMFNLWNNILIK
ncbi:MAG: hypothetical protein KH899_01910 [Haemophilus pittmaniae]|uniref:hypothetical protein n=1 Tax=Haemophilus pittmaniae TaxID=249188 RepID=UPI0023F2EFEB|nr:hypothetical protein [Haemophilus pittmaniae]MBS6026348.1 hypothetical protein [Haemophilus pittmaniae]